MADDEDKPILIDTNIIVHAVRGDATWDVVKARFDLLMRTPTPEFSVVSEGEIRSLAKQWNWGALKINQMEFLLGYFLRQPIENANVIEAYATIDAYSKSSGKTMGKNDLWIAATAYVANATLLTTDSDFDHLTPHIIDLAKV